MFVAELQRQVSKFDMPGEGQRLIVGEDLFQRLLLCAVKSVQFDPEWYLSTYKDVEQAIEAGTVGSANDHFVYYGYLEGRLPRRIEVDAPYYLAVNKDVAEAIERGEVEDAQSHFEKQGHKEGRLPFENFRLF